MKKAILLTIFMLMFSLALASAASVDISPSNPDSGDDLVVDIAGSATYDYYWYRDGNSYSSDMNVQDSKISASNTESGETWTVKVYVPATSFTEAYYLGSDSVTIENGGESTEEPNETVYITPSNPIDSDDLNCDVSDSEATYDFYWYDGNGFIESDMNVKSATLKASETDVGETYTCKVYVPATSFTEAYYLGKDSVTVQDDEENNAPRATGAHIQVGPGKEIQMNVEVVDSYLMFQAHSKWNAMFESDTVYVYDADGDIDDYSFSSPLDNNGYWNTDLTDRGSYEAEFTVTDSHNESDESTVSITVDYSIMEIDPDMLNHGPHLNDLEDITVYEGDLVDVTAYAQDEDEDELTFEWTFDFDGEVETESESYWDNIEVLPYFPDGLNTDNDLEVTKNPEFENSEIEIAKNPEFGNNENVFDLNDVEIMPIDPETALGISTADSTMTWQTQIGDAGVYDVTVRVEDEHGYGVSESFTITVLEVNDENNAPTLEVEDIEVDEGDLIDIEVDGNDIDGDELEYSWDLGDIEDATAEGESFVWQTDCYDSGEYYVSVTVTDGQLSTTGRFKITVNEALVCSSNYEGDKLYVKEINVVNAADLASAYGLEGLEVEATGDYFVEDNTLYSENTDNVVYVQMTLHNKNSFDARDLQVTFILDGQRSYANFNDLDRSEKGTQMYAVGIPEDLESGKYTLQVIIQNDDLYNEEFINLEIDSLGDVIQDAIEEQEANKTFWEKFLELF